MLLCFLQLCYFSVCEQGMSFLCDSAGGDAQIVIAGGQETALALAHHVAKGASGCRRACRPVRTC